MAVGFSPKRPPGALSLKHGGNNIKLLLGLSPNLTEGSALPSLTPHRRLQQPVLELTLEGCLQGTRRVHVRCETAVTPSQRPGRKDADLTGQERGFPARRGLARQP